MYDRFSDRTIECIIRAQDEARGLGQNQVGTEHLLLSISMEAHSNASITLMSVPRPWQPGEIDYVQRFADKLGEALGKR